MLQKQLLGHSLVSLSDMVAVLGETTGCLALPNLRDKMKNHPEGYHILQCVPPHPSHPRCVVCDGEADTRPSRFLGPCEGRAWKQHKCFVSSNPPGCLFHFIFKVHRSSVTHLRAGTAACLFCFTAGTGSCQHHKMQHQAQERNPWMWMLMRTHYIHGFLPCACCWSLALETLSLLACLLFRHFHIFFPGSC